MLHILIEDDLYAVGVAAVRSWPARCQPRDSTGAWRVREVTAVVLALTAGRPAVGHRGVKALARAGMTGISKPRLVALPTAPPDAAKDGDHTSAHGLGVKLDAARRVRIDVGRAEVQFVAIGPRGRGDQ